MPDLISHGVAWFLAWLFATAALHKLRASAWYAGLLASWFPRLNTPGLLVRLAALLEAFVALTLVLPQLQAAGLLAAAMLLLVYAMVMAVQVAQGRRDLECGCAGPASDTRVSPALLLRNLVCAGLALVAILPPATVEAGVTGVGLSLAVACFLAIFYLASEQMIANAQQLAGGR